MKIAVFADLHYTAGSSIKARLLGEAFATAKAYGVDSVICIGDMLGNGTKAEAEELAAIVAKADLPVAMTHGNAELRTPAETSSALAVLHGVPPPEGVSLIDSSEGACPPESIDAIHGKGLLVATHVPPASQGGASLEAWRHAIDGGTISVVVSGHLHEDSTGNAAFVTRGLDPDKAAGGPPAFPIFEQTTSGWRIDRIVETPGVAPANWSADFRKSMVDNLGFSTMYDPFGGLDFAIREKVPNVEIRAGSWNHEDFGKLKDAIRIWRDCGGSCLSIHLPDLRFADGGCSGIDCLSRVCSEALEAGCDRGTLHVPAIRANIYDRETDLVRKSFEKALAPLVGTGFKVGVENMHMAPRGESVDERGFGFTPEECRKQISLLRGIPGLNVGMHIDIGHARNNAPFDHPYTLSHWYEQLGRECNGMHIHQVTMKADGTIANHKPLTGCFDKLISLSSLIIARRDGMIPSVPMFLEIREGLGPDCYLALKRIFGAIDA